LLFFLSSRRRHTRCYRDWSSDVCSSDLVRVLRLLPAAEADARTARLVGLEIGAGGDLLVRILPRQPNFNVVGLRGVGAHVARTRSEERRVGKGCRSRGEACGAAGTLEDV